MKKAEKIVRGKKLPGSGKRVKVPTSENMPGNSTRSPENGSGKSIVPQTIVPQNNQAKCLKDDVSTGQNACSPEALADALHLSRDVLPLPELPTEPVSPASVSQLATIPNTPATVSPERAERDLTACEQAVQWDTYKRRLRTVERAEASAAILRAEGEIVLESDVIDRVESAGGVARYAERVDAIDKLKNRFCVEYVRDVYNLLLLGLSDSEIETFLGVDKGSVDVWASKYPAFRRVLRDGRDRACSAVARAMYQKAIGYRTVKHKQAVLGGKVVDFEEEVVFPPDVVAQKFILCNRQPDKWKERQTVDLGELGDLGDMLEAARKRVETGESGGAGL